MKQLAILGSPISQALSPVLHRAAYAELGLDWTYRAIDTTPDQLPGFLARLDDTWAGLSLTMPIKRAVLPLLDEITPLVQATGSANTILVRDGHLLGDNTDVHGMLTALTESAISTVSSATVLGAGATAATALAVLHTIGCPNVTVIARDTARAGNLTRAATRIGLDMQIRPWTCAPDHLNTDLVISTLPPYAADPLAPLWRSAANTLFDVTYRPSPSRIAQAAHHAGSQVITGLPMLVHQAARQVELQTGRAPAPLDAIRHAVELANTSPTAAYEKSHR